MRFALLAAAFALAAATPQAGPKEQLKQALKDTSPVGPWIYDDIDAGFSEAQKTGKPLLVVFR
jgi:hypothetical protein